MKSASPDVKIEFGPSPGSPAQLADITHLVVSDVALGGEGIYVDGTAYGMTNVVNLPVGITNQPDITLEGFYDDADEGPHDIFGTISGADTLPYTLKVTWTKGSPASSTEIPVHIASFNIIGKVKDVTRFRVVLKQAGATVQTRQGA
jgi:hypothetical protein